jgi:multidrug resistance efflux pump
MDMKTLKYIFLAALLVLLLPACTGMGKAAEGDLTPTPPPPQKADINIVSEGRVVPADAVHLAFFASGFVNEVLVEEGDIVTTGEVVARLGNREEIESTIANARLELLSARQALDALEKDMDVRQAQAWEAYVTARETYSDTLRTRDNLNYLANSPSAQTARQELEIAQGLVRRLRQAYKRLPGDPETDPGKAKALFALKIARLKAEAAQKKVDAYGGEPDAADLERVNADLALAQARLEKSRRDFESLQEGPDPAEVELAEARIQAAEASLAAAQAALAHLELLATQGGTVVAQDLVAGEPVTPGEPVLRLADFSQMYVETDDLTEIEVVDITIGQKVTVIPDALPDIALTGTVESISQVYEEKRGDITYTARILLDSADPRLRWGMTVAITFVK